MNLCIFGSRSLDGDPVRAIILDELSRYDVREMTIITSGGTAGVCQCARDLAKEKCLPLLVFWADAGRYARGMFDHRSRACLSVSDRVLFVWDGRSRGTANEMELAKKLKVPYRCEQLSSPEDTSPPLPEGLRGPLPIDPSELAGLRMLAIE